jgi:NADH dehydrogenase
VRAIDLDRRTVTVDSGITLKYDYLVVAAGSVSTSFGITGVDEHALPLKTLHDAIRLRTRLLAAFEHAGSEVAAGRPRPDLSIVVVGGGPTGVETAGGLRELVDRVLTKDFKELHLDGLSITLVEAAPRVLGPFHPKSSAKAEETLARRGADHRCRCRHVGPTASCRRRAPPAVGGHRSGANVVQAGRGAARYCRWHGGRSQCDLTCRSKVIPVLRRRHRTAPTDDEHPAAGRATGVQGWPHAAAQIRRCRGPPDRPFHYRQGSMATIGHRGGHRLARAGCVSTVASAG